MAPRVVVVGLASDFGCQVQITNIEDHLLEMLGVIDLGYWQLASSGHMPAEYDIAVVEGAVTTVEHIELLKRLRETASVVMTIGTCAHTGGIPALANRCDLDAAYSAVYGEGSDVARGRCAPEPVHSVIDVDYQVPGCPIDMDEFLAVLSKALQGLADPLPGDPMCAVCKTKENVCLLDRGEICLGLVTRTGCGAKCPSLGRPCTGCRGLAPDANFDAARKVLASKGFDPNELDRRFDLYNAVREGVR